MRLLSLFFLLLGGTASAGYPPIPLQLIEIAPRKGPPFYALFPLWEEYVGDGSSKLRALISVAPGPARILNPLEPIHSDRTLISISGLDAGKVCFGDPKKCMMPAGKLQFFAPFPEECQNQSNFKEWALSDIKSITFFKTITPEQKNYIRYRLSYARYVNHCTGDQLKLPPSSPYSSFGGEGGGYQLIYSNPELPKNPKISEKFTPLYFQKESSEFDEPIAYFDGRLDPLNPEYPKIRNSIAHFCSRNGSALKLDRGEVLYLSESEGHSKRNTLIFDDLPKDLVSLPEGAFEKKFGEFLLSKVTSTYSRYLEKRKREIELPHRQAQTELETLIKSGNAGKWSGPERLNPKDLKLYHLDLKSRCLTTTSKTNWQEFSECARQSLDDLLSKETQTFLDRHAPFHIRCYGFDLEDIREATHE